MLDTFDYDQNLAYGRMNATSHEGICDCLKSDSVKSDIRAIEDQYTCSFMYKYSHILVCCVFVYHIKSFVDHLLDQWEFD